jgi:predicted DNA-binding transcriptional regulator AlpA
MSLSELKLALEIALKQVLSSKHAAAFRGVSDREWARMVADGRAPKPIKRGKRANGWTLEDLIAMDGNGNAVAPGENVLQRAKEAVEALGRAVEQGLVDQRTAALTMRDVAVASGVNRVAAT